MPRRRTSLKSNRVNKRKHTRNLKVKVQLKKAIKKFHELLSEKNSNEAKTFIAKVFSQLDKAAKKNIPILLPVDHVIADKFDANANTKVVGEDIPDGWMALDIGPKTIKLFEDKLKTAKTVVWNGPMGVFEMDKFAKGTERIAKFLAGLKGAITIIGGGDTAAAMSKFKVDNKMTHISTGGGASLEYLEGRGLPGIDALQDR